MMSNESDLEQQNKQCKEMLQSDFPRVYASLNAFNRKILNWSDEYKLAADRYYPDSMDDAALRADCLNIRRLDIEAIRQILARKDGIQRIFSRDIRGKSILHFVAKAQDAEKKKKLNELLYSAILQDLERTYNDPAAVKLSAELSDKYGHIGFETGLSISQFEKLPAIIVAAEKCNQAQPIKEWASSLTERDQRLVALVMTAAAQHNHQSIFNYLSSLNFPQHIKLEILRDVFVNLQFCNLNISQSFRNQLFDVLLALDREKVSLGTDKPYPYIGNIFLWASILNQLSFFKDPLQYVSSLSWETAEVLRNGVLAKSLLNANYYMNPVSMAARQSIELFNAVVEYNNSLPRARGQEASSFSTWQQMITHPLFNAIKSDDIPLIKMLCDHQELSSAELTQSIKEAAYCGRLSAFKYFEKRGANIDDPKFISSTMENQQLYILDYVISQHPELQNKYFFHKPPSSSWISSIAVYEWIYKHGVDITRTCVNETMNVKESLLHFAANETSDVTKRIAYLCDKGADVCLRDSNNETPLMKALKKLYDPGNPYEFYRNSQNKDIVINNICCMLRYAQFTPGNNAIEETAEYISTRLRPALRNQLIEEIRKIPENRIVLDYLLNCIPQNLSLATAMSPGYRR